MQAGVTRAGLPESRIMRLAGTAREVGFQIGRSLGVRLSRIIDTYLESVRRNVAGIDPERLRSGSLPWLRSLPARFVEEAEGVADGARLPLQNVAEWLFVDSCIPGGCSGAMRMIDGHVWVARNNDLYRPRCRNAALRRRR